MSGRGSLAQAGEVRSAVGRGLPDGVWPALGVLLLCLLLVAVVTRVRSLRREARARRLAREAKVGAGTTAERPPPTRPLVVEPSLPAASGPSSREGKPDPEVRSPEERSPAERSDPLPARGPNGLVERRGPVRAGENGKPSLPAPPAGGGLGRVEATLFDAEGNRTRRPRQAVRGEMVGYDADGREVGRAAVVLPRPGPAPRPAPALTTRRRRVPPPAANRLNGGNGRPTTRRRRRVVPADAPPAPEPAREPAQEPDARGADPA